VGEHNRLHHLYAAAAVAGREAQRLLFPALDPGQQRVRSPARAAVLGVERLDVLIHGPRPLAKP